MAARAKVRATAARRMGITTACTAWRPPRCLRVWRPMWGRCGKSATRTPRTWRRHSTRRCSYGAPVSAKRWRWRAAASARGNRISTSSSRDRDHGVRRGPGYAAERGMGRHGAVRRPDADGAAAPQSVGHERFRPAQRREAPPALGEHRPTPSPGAVNDAYIFITSTSSLTAAADLFSAACSSASSFTSIICSIPFAPSFTGTPRNCPFTPYSPSR